MSRIFWVDNTAGSIYNNGLSYESAFLKIDNAIDAINANGAPGDIMRICYTGQNYDFDAVGLSYIGSGGTYNVCGTGWGEGEYFKVEGYDPAGGYNRPLLVAPGGASTGFMFYLDQKVNFWYFSDLDFGFASPNTSGNAGFIRTINSLTDGTTFFKIRRCRLTGNYSTSTSVADIGVYVIGYGSSYWDIKYNYFNDVRYPIRTVDANPAPLGLDIRYNVFDYTAYSGQIQIELSEAGDPIDFTYAHNTHLSRAGATTNSCVYFIDGFIDTTDGDKFSFKNNFCCHSQYQLRGGASATCETDITNYVGYNTWAAIASSTNSYTGAFDVCETEANNRAVGDYNLQAYSIAQALALFADADSTTYFWPESGWMYIPDLRPVGNEMTGTWEDPVSGLRGAIQYSGIYKDTSVDTQHYCTIEPYYKANTIIDSEGISSGDIYKMFDTNRAEGLNMDYTSEYSLVLSDFCYYGTKANCGYNIHSISLKTGTYTITSSIQAAAIHRRGSDATSVYARTQVRYTGVADYTSGWSAFTKGQRANQVPQPLGSGSYPTDIRFWTAHDDGTSAWDTFYTIVIP